MRRLLQAGALAVVLVNNSGCFVNLYSSDPNRRVLELLNQSEDLRMIEDEWERFWFTDQPSKLTPYRTSGGLM